MTPELKPPDHNHNEQLPYSIATVERLAQIAIRRGNDLLDLARRLGKITQAAIEQSPLGDLTIELTDLNSRVAEAISGAKTVQEVPRRIFASLTKREDDDEA